MPIYCYQLLSLTEIVFDHGYNASFNCYIATLASHLRLTDYVCSLVSSQFGFKLGVEVYNDWLG